jgi:hypothetical protein
MQSVGGSMQGRFSDSSDKSRDDVIVDLVRLYATETRVPSEAR